MQIEFYCGESYYNIVVSALCMKSYTNRVCKLKARKQEQIIFKDTWIAKVAKHLAHCLWMH